jgi:Ser/Thr protein kinase RdoA (MazF antagonist)
VIPKIERSIISSAYLQKIVQKRYDLGNINVFKFYQMGFNDTYYFATFKKEYFLRVYRYKWRTCKQIDEELETLNYLSQSGLDVTTPIKSTTGTMLGSIRTDEGIRYYVVFEKLYGKPSIINKEVILSAGMTLALLHKRLRSSALQGIKRSIFSPELIINDLTVTLPIISKRTSDMIHFEKEGLYRIGEKIMRFDTAPVHLIHGDYLLPNILVGANNKIQILDFDFLSRGFVAYDLAVFIWGLAGGDSKRSNYLRSFYGNIFLNEYSKHETIAFNLQDLRSLMALRQMWLLLTHNNLTKEMGSSWFTEKFINDQIKMINKWLAP